VPTSMPHLFLTHPEDSSAWSYVGRPFRCQVPRHGWRVLSRHGGHL